MQGVAATEHERLAYICDHEFKESGKYVEIPTTATTATIIGKHKITKTLKTGRGMTELCLCLVPRSAFAKMISSDSTRTQTQLC